MYKSRKVSVVNDRSDLCITVMFYIAKFWGLAPFNLKNNRLSTGSWIDNVYPTIFILSLLPVVIYIIIAWAGIQYPGLTSWTRAVDVVSLLVGYVATATSVIRVLGNKDMVIEIIELLIKIRETMNIFGCGLDCKRKLKYLALQTGFSIVVVITFDTIGSIAFGGHFHIPILVIFNFIYKTMYLTLHVLVIMFVGILSFSKHYFEPLNHKLFNILDSKCKSITARPRYGGWVDKKSANTRVRDVEIGIEADFRAIHNCKSIQILVQIEREYLDIFTVIEKTVKLFSPALLLIIGFYTLEIFLNTYYTYNVINDLLGTIDYKLCSKVTGAVLWIVPKILTLWFIAHMCHSVQEVGKSMADILYEMWIINRPNELKDEIQIFFLRLVQKPLDLSAFGFFSFDYSYLYKIFCAVVAYFIIMLQLDSAKSSCVGSDQMHQSTWNFTVSK